MRWIPYSPTHTLRYVLAFYGTFRIYIYTLDGKLMITYICLPPKCKVFDSLSLPLLSMTLHWVDKGEHYELDQWSDSIAMVLSHK